MNNQNSKADYLTGFLIFILIFMTMGWYFAESENELLKEEQLSQNYTKPIHIEGICHDR